MRAPRADTQVCPYRALPRSQAPPGNAFLEALPPAKNPAVYGCLRVIQKLNAYRAEPGGMGYQAEPGNLV